MATDVPPLDWPHSAAELLAQAKAASAACGELVRLVMSGVRRLDSWLIENRVLPAVADRGIRVLEFIRSDHDQERRLAAVVPLPDGSALVCSSSGRWSALDSEEAMAAVEYIGHHYAPGDHWSRDFQATVRSPGQPPVPLTPEGAAALWQEVTGRRPHGFDASLLDQMQTFGRQVIDRAFNTQGVLGL